MINKELLTQIDIMNTLNGGMSEPSVLARSEEDESRLFIKIPGVDAERLNVEVQGNLLLVFQEMPFKTARRILTIPRIVVSHPIPSQVDRNKIQATYDDGFLAIQLPYGKRTNGYFRKIRINRPE